MVDGEGEVDGEGSTARPLRQASVHGDKEEGMGGQGEAVVVLELGVGPVEGGDNQEAREAGVSKEAEATLAISDILVTQTLEEVNVVHNEAGQTHKEENIGQEVEWVGEGPTDLEKGKDKETRVADDGDLIKIQCRRETHF